jgi:hypothetical protein
MKKALLSIWLVCSAYAAFSFATVTEKEWRWRKDDGDEATATWATTNNNESITTQRCDVGENIRLRINFEISAGPFSSSINVTPTLSYASSPNGTYTTINNTIDANHQHFVMSVSSNTGYVSTTQQISSGTYTSGKVFDKTSPSSLLFSTSPGVTSEEEVEWVLTPTQYAKAQTYYFKLSGVTGYDASLPTLTVGSAVNANVTNISCNGLVDGKIDLTLSNIPSPTITWDNSSTGLSRTNLGAGPYTVTVTDLACTKTYSDTVIEPAVISASVFQTDACGSGTAMASATGGTAPLSFLWSPSGSTSSTASGLAVGTNTVSVTDANNCPAATASLVIFIYPAVSVTVTQSVTGCQGDNTNEATATVTGGTGSIDYVWSNSATSTSISGLSPGPYSVSVSDDNNCTASDGLYVDDFAVDVSQTVTACAGTDASVAEATVNIATGTITYAWSPSGGSNAIATNLTPDFYTATATDNTTGCVATNTVDLVETDPIVASVSQTDIGCGGGDTSFAYVDASGGYGNLTYAWAPAGGTDATSVGLAADDYTITVTDDNQCVSTLNITITEYPAIQVSVSQTVVGCTGSNEGTALAVASNGTSPYAYAWSPSGGTNATATSLAPNTYTITVTDDNSCKASANVTITEQVCTDVTNSVSGTASVDLYPNPVSKNDILSVNVKGNVSIEKIILMDSHQKTLMSVLDPTQLNTQSLDAGMYIMQIVTDKGVMIKKLIVE